ncbi:MAG: glycosyltransferase, partial [Eubacteriales bacterium]|nr:glycosyltransferase [Eubacteriales bacterium]
MKKISVIVPCYNVDKYIDRCVESLVNQTLGINDMELIFVDDASTDHTLDKLAVWEEKYPDSILVIHCAENRRQGAARNIGMQYASGEYIGFVDSDDYVSSEMYQILYEKAAAHQCDVAGCLFVREQENGIIAMDEEPFQMGDRYVKIQNVPDRKRLMRRGLPGGVWCKIYSHALLADAELYFPEQIRYEDNYWSAFMLQEISDYYIVNQPLYHYIVNEQSTIMSQDATHHLDRLVIELMKV